MKANFPTRTCVIVILTVLFSKSTSFAQDVMSQEEIIRAIEVGYSLSMEYSLSTQNDDDALINNNLLQGKFKKTKDCVLNLLEDGDFPKIKKEVLQKEIFPILFFLLLILLLFFLQAQNHCLMMKTTVYPLYPNIKPKRLVIT